jgi:general secretion pathway protein D
VFGENSKSPVAGMFRFMPLEGANAVLVITSQPNYLDDIKQWLDRIDSAAGGVQLYSYELKYIKAKDLADRLSRCSVTAPAVPPMATVHRRSCQGLQSVELTDNGDAGGSTAQMTGSGYTDTGSTRRPRRGHGAQSEQ